MNRPAFMFYPGDWLRDSVAGCSLAAQGLWLRMMVIAHDSELYGYLCQNGGPMPSAAIARRCGVSIEEYDVLIAELKAAGVPSTREDGTLFSRRMVRDAHGRDLVKKRTIKHRTRNANATLV